MGKNAKCFFFKKKGKREKGLVALVYMMLNCKSKFMLKMFYENMHSCVNLCIVWRQIRMMLPTKQVKWG